uniref:TNF receptor superfamily member 4 n=1 Tax=Homo sapiens TaxID=9606 RepID=A0A8V8TQV7_HUMAN
MCVGARRLGRGPCAALLLLGLGLSTVTGLHCVGDTYPSNDRCCHECRPGNGMVSRCSRSQNTVCRPCGPGFYNDVVSSKPCKPCTWCNLRSGSERKQLCTATQDTVCRCRAGTQPLDSYKPGVDCAPCPPGHFSPGDNQACKPWTKPCGCRHPGPGPGAGAAGPPGHPAGPVPAPEGPEAAPRCPQAPWGRQFPDPHPRGAGRRPLHPGQDLTWAHQGGRWAPPGWSPEGLLGEQGRCRPPAPPRSWANSAPF